MADETDDPVENVTDTIKQRLKSPFYGSWAIAFVVLNWRAIYYLLFPDSELSLEQRLYEIDHTVYPDFWADHVPKLLVLPVVFACIAVAVVPWLLVWLDGPRYSASITMDNRRKRSDEQRKDQQLEIAALKKKIDEMGRAMKDQTDAMEKRLTEKTNEVQGVTQNFTDSLSARNELQKAYRYKIALLMKRTERVKNVFHAISEGREWKEANDETRFLADTLGVVEMGGNGSYVMNEEGRAIRKMAP